MTSNATDYDLPALRELAVRKAAGDGGFAALAVLLAYAPIAQQPMFTRHLAEGADFPAILADETPEPWSTGQAFLIRSAAALFNNLRGEFAVNLGQLELLTEDEARVWDAMIAAHRAKGLAGWIPVIAGFEV